MATKKPPKKKAVTKLKPNKLALWLKAFTDQANPTTYLNKTASAKHAKYKAKSENAFQQIGYQNFIKLQPTLLEWVNEHKLSQSALRFKLSELLEVEKTTFHKVKGKVNDTLPSGVTIVAESSKMSMSGRGEDAEMVDDGETLLAINVADPEIQRKTLDMALKVTGEYAPEKREITGKDGQPIPLTAFPPEPQSMEDWQAMRLEEEKKQIITQS